MKKIFLDTNFIFDCFLREEYFTICDEFVSRATLQGYTFYISFLTIANFAYIIRKEPRGKIISLIKRILDNFQVLPNNKEQIERAIKMTAVDFEDLLQYQVAIDNNCEFIITRNEKDFEFSAIPVMSAADFIKKILI